MDLSASAQSVGVSAYRRLNSCLFFGEAKCPYQEEMEKVYLIPQLIDSERLLEYRNLCLNCMRRDQTRRKSPRVLVSFLVCCRQADLAKVGGKAYNLSSGGMAIKTNFPICLGEHLAVEIHLHDAVESIEAAGKVVWCQFHYDDPGQAETLFTAGIKFIDPEEPLHTLVSAYSLGRRQ